MLDFKKRFIIEIVLEKSAEDSTSRLKKTYVTVKHSQNLIDPAHGVFVSQQTMLHFDW